MLLVIYVIFLFFFVSFARSWPTLLNFSNSQFFIPLIFVYFSVFNFIDFCSLLFPSFWLLILLFFYFLKNLGFEFILFLFPLHYTAMKSNIFYNYTTFPLYIPSTFTLLLHCYKFLFQHSFNYILQIFIFYISFFLRSVYILPSSDTSVWPMN